MSSFSAVPLVVLVPTRAFSLNLFKAFLSINGSNLLKSISFILSISWLVLKPSKKLINGNDYFILDKWLIIAIWYASSTDDDDNIQAPVCLAA